MEDGKSRLARGLSIGQFILAVIGVLAMLLGGFLGAYVRLDRMEQRLIQMSDDPKRITALELDVARIQLRIEQMQQARRGK